MNALLCLLPVTLTRSATILLAHTAALATLGTLVTGKHAQVHNLAMAKSLIMVILITRIIKDRIGRHDVLLSINHKHYNFRKKESFNWKKKIIAMLKI